MHEDWTGGGIEAGGGSHRVVKKMLAGDFYLVCFWDQGSMKDVVNLTSGWFSCNMILSSNQKRIVGGRHGDIK